MNMDIQLDEIKEEQETYSDDSLYNITSFGTDMMLSQIITMYKDGDLEKPDLQRKYVWSKNEASRFIDSILLGLPVPSIFLAKTEDKRLLIVDGYQRIMTIFEYLEVGTFSGDGNVFKLSKSEMIHPSWRGKAYVELTEAQKRAIRTYTIHAIVFEQKHPQNDTGMYQIFERINTGGRVLKAQEIRNCVYHGVFNEMLRALNKDECWRTVLGSDAEDSRMSDVELILRFFAFVYLKDRDEYNQSQINLIKYLNDFMGSFGTLSEDEREKMTELFLRTIRFLNEKVGMNLFRNAKEKNGHIAWAKKVNPVIFDAVCTATVLCWENISSTDFGRDNLRNNYESLVFNDEFIRVTKQRTTNLTNIKKRVALAAEILYGVEL